MRCFPKILLALSVLFVSSRAQTDSDADGSIDAQGEIVLESNAEKPEISGESQSDPTNPDTQESEMPGEESEVITESEDDETIVIEEEEGLILGGGEENILIIEEKQLEETVPGTSAEADENDEIIGGDKTETAEGDEEDSDEYDYDYEDEYEDEYEDDRGRFYEEESPYADDDMPGSEDEDDEAEDDEPEKPAIVEKPRSINVAKNLEEYRSPRVAMFLSLLVPGLGQAYARNYWKTAAFGVVEAALIGTAIGFSLEGKKYEEQALDHAKEHYNPEKFYRFYENFRSYLQTKDNFDESLIDSIIEADYYWDNAETFVQTDSGTISPKTDRFDVKNNPPEGFEDVIDAEGYVQGWDDAEPYMTEEDGWTLDSSTYGSKWLINSDNYLVYKDEAGQDSTDYSFGHSELLEQYRDIKDDARRQYRVRNIMIYSLLANHVVSAVDALITARAHNNRLLGKQSFLDRVNLDYDIAMTDTDITSYYWVRVRF